MNKLYRMIEVKYERIRNIGMNENEFQWVMMNDNEYEWIGINVNI